MNNFDSLKTGIKGKSSLMDKVRHSLFCKLLVIGAVLLLCGIPMLLVVDKIYSREHLAESVEVDVADKWGLQQVIFGPVLEIPISRDYNEVGKAELSYYYLTPDKLVFKGTLFPEIRYRGIYEVLLYRSDVTVSGKFNCKFTIPKEWKADLSGARLVIGVSDIKGLSQIAVKIDGSNVDFKPGVSNSGPVQRGFNVPVDLTGYTGNLEFDFSFGLKGCRSLAVTPMGRDTVAELASNWNTPSFTGDFLPHTRSVDENGFSARWEISEFNHSVPSGWIGSEVVGKQESAGVSLIRQVGIYSQLIRSLDYCILVFLVVLMTYLIFETLIREWIHPLQYLVIGLSLVLFYVMALAISEHLGFTAGFWISAVLVVLLGVFYSRLIFRKKSACLGISLATLLAYGVIFVILQLEDYALLAGSGILFLLLLVFMALTGKINRTQVQE